MVSILLCFSVPTCLVLVRNSCDGKDYIDLPTDVMQKCRQPTSLAGILVFTASRFNTNVINETSVNPHNNVDNGARVVFAKRLSHFVQHAR